MTPDRRLALTAGTGILLVAGVILISLLAGGQTNASGADWTPPDGYTRILRFRHEGRSLSFGPFVGYAFRPVEAGRPDRVAFVCRNIDSFYTNDLPAGALLFTGEAVLTTLPDAGRSLPDRNRINPVFFDEAPSAWTASRPEPQDAYLHFHSAYDAEGAVRTGYWLRHEAEAAFTYDMGGRVGPQSPLHHEVTPGVDRAFAAVIEFDHGPPAGK
ncbi:MAG: hypothetical protein ACOCX4_00470 [Planctomycetota bacterium]